MLEEPQAEMEAKEWPQPLLPNVHRSELAGPLPANTQYHPNCRRRTPCWQAREASHERPQSKEAYLP